MREPSTATEGKRSHRPASFESELPLGPKIRCISRFDDQGSLVQPETPVVPQDMDAQRRVHTTAAVVRAGVGIVEIDLPGSDPPPRAQVDDPVLATATPLARDQLAAAPRREADVTDREAMFDESALAPGMEIQVGVDLGWFEDSEPDGTKRSDIRQRLPQIAFEYHEAAVESPREALQRMDTGLSSHAPEGARKPAWRQRGSKLPRGGMDRDPRAVRQAGGGRSSRRAETSQGIVMQLRYEPLHALPRLAWCARMRAGDPVARIRHGRDVETREDCFFEGAWDGCFEAGRPDEAAVMVGTGARATRERICFAASSNLSDRLYSMRLERELLVSNSLTFLLVEAGGEPDPDYLYHGGEFLRQALQGIHRSGRTLSARPAPATLHECVNLQVDSSLTLRRVRKQASRKPLDYADYVDLLRDVLAQVFANAAHPRRIQRYRPLATLSRGYDAAAVAALAVACGCTEAFTFVEELPGSPMADDNGKAVGVCLGLNVTEYSRRPGAAHRDLFEAEFCACPPGVDAILAATGDALGGRLLLTGHFGDDVWNRDPSKILPDLRQQTAAGLSGTALTEFRLRVGFQHFPLPFTAAEHIEAIHAISISPALQPWSLGGSYDRPIPRRIVEEAGVPRELFGQKKIFGTGTWPLVSAADLSEASRRDFDAFCAKHSPDNAKLRRAQSLRKLYRAHRRLSESCARAAAAVGSSWRPAPLLSARYALRPSHNLLFHWGFGCIRQRYHMPMIEARGADRLEPPSEA